MAKKSYYLIITNDGAGDSYVTFSDTAKHARERCGLNTPEARAWTRRVSKKYAEREINMRHAKDMS